MKIPAAILLCFGLVLAGCITAVTPEKAANLDLKKTGLVLATLSKSGDAGDRKRVVVEFYLRPTTGRGDVLKELVVNDSKDLWLIEVPIGHYRIADWFLGAGTMRRESAEKGFEFEVRPEEITYIGHFEVAVARARNTFGLRVIPQAMPLLKDDYANAIATFRQRYPALTGVTVRNVAPAEFIWGSAESNPVPLYLPVPVIK